MKESINEKIKDLSLLRNGYVIRDGFVFTSIGEPTNVFNALVIRYPEDAYTHSPHLPKSTRSFQEHIGIINSLGVESALIICDSLEFIDRCQPLRKLKIIPSESAPSQFDYSPLYSYGKIEHLSCQTRYGTSHNCSTQIDYSKIYGLRQLRVVGSDYTNLENIHTLESLWLVDDVKNIDLMQIGSNKNLKQLVILKCALTSLKGIEQLANIQTLTLWRNSKLSNISDLDSVRSSLTQLSIQNCPRIAQFQVLEGLSMLENLELSGNNDLQNLRFLNAMTKMRTFSFSMNVVDGDLSNCLKIPFVSCTRNRKNYNLKDKDLPKKIIN